MKADPYHHYLQTYGKATSGMKITDEDFRARGWLSRFRGVDRAVQIAVALAVHDMTKDQPLKSASEFRAELQRMLA